MRCPRCQSPQVQRGYNDSSILVRLAGRHKLLCNNCGLEFKRFQWSTTFEQAPGKSDETKVKRRRAPRYRTHLPATIRLITVGTNTETSFSSPLRGHCKTISSLGMALSFVGSRIDPNEFATPGRLLLVIVNLPDSAMEVVVKTITHQRIENRDGRANWFVGTAIVQISDADRAQLITYLERRASEPA